MLHCLFHMFRFPIPEWNIYTQINKKIFKKTLIIIKKYDQIKIKPFTKGPQIRLRSTNQMDQMKKKMSQIDIRHGKKTVKNNVESCLIFKSTKYVS
jgi:hypothetical protein